MALAATIALSMVLFVSRGMTFALAASPPSTATERPAPTKNPLGSATVEHLVFDGSVVERLSAGPYTYLRVASDEGIDRWIVVVGHGEELGTRIGTRSFGARSQFFSKRLDRTFDELHFALIHRLEPTLSTKEYR
jgi:hypothetical protein